MHGEQTVPAEDVQGAERLARYLTRGPLPIDVVEKVEGGRLRVRTPPDPRTGLVEKILDPLDLIPGGENVSIRDVDALSAADENAKNYFTLDPARLPCTWAVVDERSDANFLKRNP